MSNLEINEIESINEQSCLIRTQVNHIRAQTSDCSTGVYFYGVNNVGKKSIYNKICTLKQPPSDLSQMYSEIFQKSGIKVRLHLWKSTDYSVRLHEIEYHNIKSGIAIVVYDVSNRKSFEQVQKQIDYLRNPESNIIIILVGNKTDLEHTVTIDEANELATRNNISLYFCNAKTGAGVRTIFDEAAAKYALKYLEKKRRIDEELKIQKKEDELKKKNMSYCTIC
jgi:hypothetical protein